MAAPSSLVETIKQKTSDLDLTLRQHNKIYQKYSKAFIILNEVHWKMYQNTITPIVNHKAYFDNAKPPKITIGIGFNMDSIYARKIWSIVFENNVSFEDVYTGKIHITDKEANYLFNYVIGMKRNELKTFFHNEWNQLKANERISIESLHYNGGHLVIAKNGFDTNFSKNIRMYTCTAKTQYLNNAIMEIKYRSNLKQDKGIQNRREAEALMLAS